MFFTLSGAPKGRIKQSREQQTTVLFVYKRCKLGKAGGWSRCPRVFIGHKAFAEVLLSFLISGGHSVALDIRSEKCHSYWKIKKKKLYQDVIPTQALAYLFCQDLLAKSTILAEDLNLCRKCGKKTAGHPPKTCSFVTKELNELFSSKRAEFEESYKKHELAFNKSPMKMGISLKNNSKVFDGNWIFFSSFC